MDVLPCVATSLALFAPNTPLDLQPGSPSSISVKPSLVRTKWPAWIFSYPSRLTHVVPTQSCCLNLKSNVVRVAHSNRMS